MGRLGTFSPTATPVTGPQLSYLESLTRELFRLNETISGTPDTDGLAGALAVLPSLSKRDASDRIGDLKNDRLPRLRATVRAHYASQPVERPASAPAPVELDTDALYLVDGNVVRLKRSGRGNLYALVLNFGTRRFDYAPGVVGRVTPDHKMTPDQGKALGDVWGYCVRCGAHLTDPVSIARGMGPVCVQYQM